MARRDERRAGAKRGKSKAKSARGDLNERQQRFAAEYLVDLNATQAAIRAGYSAKAAAVQGCQLLRNPKVAALVAEGKRRQASRLEITAERVLQELARVAFADIGQAFDEHGGLRPVHEIPEDTRRALASIESEELAEGRGAERAAVGMVRKVKLSDKLRGLELLGKHLKLFDGERQAPTEPVVFIVRGGEDVDASEPVNAAPSSGGSPGLPADPDAGAAAEEH